MKIVFGYDSSIFDCRYKLIIPETQKKKFIYLYSIAEFQQRVFEHLLDVIGTKPFFQIVFNVSSINDKFCKI